MHSHVCKGSTYLRITKHCKSFNPEIHRGQGSAKDNDNDLLEHGGTHRTVTYFLFDQLCDSQFECSIKAVGFAELLHNGLSEGRKHIGCRKR